MLGLKKLTLNPSAMSRINFAEVLRGTDDVRARILSENKVFVPNLTPAE